MGPTVHGQGLRSLSSNQISLVSPYRLSQTQLPTTSNRKTRNHSPTSKITQPHRSANHSNPVKPTVPASPEMTGPPNMPSEKRSLPHTAPTVTVSCANTSDRPNKPWKAVVSS